MAQLYSLLTVDIVVRVIERGACCLVSRRHVRVSIMTLQSAWAGALESTTVTPVLLPHAQSRHPRTPASNHYSIQRCTPQLRAPLHLNLSPPGFPGTMLCADKWF